MALYQNRTGRPIELGIGRVPGKPWDRYDAEPGQTVEGPGVPNYRQVFEAAGFTAVTPEEGKAWEEEQELLRQIEAEEKVKASAPAQEETAVSDDKTPAVEVTPDPEPPVTESPAAAAKPQKGSRRGPHRSTTG